VQLFQCPECGTATMDVRQGKELEVFALEVREGEVREDDVREPEVRG